MSALGLVNFAVLQWFGVRLCRATQHDFRWWVLLYPVVPLTGWWSDYVPARPRVVPLTSPTWRVQ